MSLSACAKKADRAPDSNSPASAGADYDKQDDLAALEQQLAAREDQLRSTGVGVSEERRVSSDDSSHGPAAPSASAPAPESQRGVDAEKRDAAAKREAPADRGGRCNQVCEISTAICELQTQICDLVPRHREDPRYQATCDRASADCRLSTEACHGCSEP